MTETTATLISEEAVRALSARQEEPEWLLAKRLAALRAFNAMVMPSGFEEDWRRTDISGLDLAAAVASVGTAAEEPLTPIQIHAVGWGGGRQPPVPDGCLQ